MVKVGLFITLIFVLVQGVKLVKLMNEYPDTRYEYSRYEEPPAELQLKLQQTEKTRNIIFTFLGLYIIFEVFSYLENPEDHFCRNAVKKFQQMTKYLNY